MIVAPNDVVVPDPGQDGYAGSVEQHMTKQAVQKVREEHRGDAGWRHDPDHQLDENAAAKEAQRQADQFTAEQHDRLMHGIAMRGGPQVGGTNYLGISHDKLHEMVNNDIDPGTVDAAGAAWNEVGVALRGIGDRLTTASAATEQAWSGSAAEGARGFNSGVAGWSETTAQGALLSSNNMATQSNAAGSAKSTVPPPMDYSPWDQVTDLLSAPDPVSGANTVRAKLAQQQELHRQAADAVAAYDQTLSNSSSTMPAFETPPAFDPSYHDPTGAPAGGSEPPPGHPRQVAPVGGPPLSGGTRPPSSESSPPTSGPGSGLSPDPNRAPDDPGIRQPGSTGTDPSRANHGQGGPGGTGVGMDGPGGLGSAGGRGPGEAGFGEAPVGGWGGGPGGVGERGGFGGPGGSGGGRGGVEGRVPGPGAGALAAEQAAMGRGAAGAAGARGAAGLGGIPMAAGGSGRGGEDEEHERPSYLLEDDPDALFGTDEAASPPVIE